MELGILDWINGNLHGSNFVNQLFRVITYLGEKGIIWIALGILLLCFKKTRKGGFLFLVSLGVGIVLNNFVIKLLVNRPRPFAEDAALADFITSIGLKLPTDSSFPSGHTQAAINAAMFLTLQFKGKGAWAWIPACLIAISRVFLCVHYPTDVLAAAVIGAVVAVLVWWLGQKLLDKVIVWWQNKKDKKQAPQEQDKKEKVAE